MRPLPPGSIAVSNVRPAVDASCALGVGQAALDPLGLTRERLADPSAWVSGATTYAHLELVAAHLGGEPRPFAAFLVDAARRYTLASLGVVGFACKTSATLGEALGHHGRFQHLTNRTASYEAKRQGDSLIVEERRPGPPRPGALWMSDYTGLVAAQLITEVAQGRVVVQALHSRRADLDPVERATLEQFLGTRVHTGHTRAGIVLPATALALPMPRADVELRAYFGELLARASHIDPDVPEFAASVHREVKAALAEGTPSAEAVARRLMLSRRTLQRRLAADGTSFDAVLRSTRHRLARAHLADRSLSLGEVAYLLGYREQSSFWRAFRRWEGATPAAWRAAQRVPESSEE
ncbi:MAG: AraC-like DNA-binding protein [Myxococcota bacterium]|jgi:AraC-like DNA-binding protein